MERDRDSEQLVSDGSDAISGLQLEEASSDRGREAFQKFYKGVTRLAKKNKEVLLSLPNKEHLLWFCAEVGRVSRYKSQALSTLQALLALPAFRAAVSKESVALQMILREALGNTFDVIFPEFNQDTPAAPPSPSAEQRIDPEERPIYLGQPPNPSQYHRSEESDNIQELSAHASEINTEVLSHASAVSDEPGQSLFQTPSEVELAASKTKELFLESITAVVSLGYEYEDRHYDRCLQAFKSLQTATNRAHWEVARRSRQARPVNNIEGDLILEALQSTSWDPRKVLLFLFHFQKSKERYRNQILSVGQKLTQISACFNDIVRSDPFLAAWLGSCKGSGPVSLLSYGIASSLRWAAWDAGWYWSNKLRRCQKDADGDLTKWEANKCEAMKTVELPHSTVSILLEAIWSAAQHCALQRFPQESQGLLGGLMGIFSGATEDKSEFKDQFHVLFNKIEGERLLAEGLVYDLKWTIWNLCWYTANKAKGYSKDARIALVTSERHFQNTYRSQTKWKGVNLGGWFLLEPGPCENFWKSLPESAQVAHCEWGCCEHLGPELAKQLLDHHRRTYFQKKDFEKMRAAGITHVRLPFGAWCICGPRGDEPYIGPCIEVLDQAIDAIEHAGLRVLLDLHGTVGGESGKAPCGHIHEGWHYSQWDQEASLEVLKCVAERYAGRTCICGIGVANEPCESIPAKKLARYYEAAVDRIRQAGMQAGSVSIVLPIFTEWRVKEFLDLWEKSYPMYEDCLFDLHLYQCFGIYWDSISSAKSHLEQAAKRAELLAGIPPCIVGEWSLALPQALETKMSSNDLREFAKAQLKAYESATHGWFFWTWRDSAGLPWNMEACLDQKVFSLTAC